jgi:hypothetical protein
MQKMKKLLVLASVAMATQLVGCVSTPHYARFSDLKDGETAGLSDPVEYKIDARVGAHHPNCIAIMPLAVAKEAADPVELPEARVTDDEQGAEAEQSKIYKRHLDAADKQRLVRKMLYGFVSPHQPHDIELERIDRLVKQDPPFSASVNRDIARALHCDWLLEGTITQFDIDYLGLYSNMKIGVDLKLIRASTGQVLWSGRHLAQSRDGGVPLSPIGLAVGAVKAASNLEPDQLEGVAADLARRLVRTMPLEDDNMFFVAARRDQHIKEIIPERLEPLYEVVARFLNLRSGPGTHYKVRQVLRDSQKVSVLDKPGKRRGWCKVRTPDGVVGFVDMRYLRQADAGLTHGS